MSPLWRRLNKHEPPKAAAWQTEAPFKVAAPQTASKTDRNHTWSLCIIGGCRSFWVATLLVSVVHVVVELSLPIYHIFSAPHVELFFPYAFRLVDVPWNENKSKEYFKKRLSRECCTLKRDMRLSRSDRRLPATAQIKVLTWYHS